MSKKKTRHEVYTGLTARGLVLWKCLCGAEGTVTTVAELAGTVHAIGKKKTSTAA